MCAKHLRSPLNSDWTRIRHESMNEPQFNHWRNRLYVWVTNWLASWLPTSDYVQFVSGAISYGMNAAARDQREGRTSPPNWEEASDV